MEQNSGPEVRETAHVGLLMADYKLSIEGDCGCAVCWVVPSVKT